jgi:hypothetical protein
MAGDRVATGDLLDVLGVNNKYFMHDNFPSHGHLEASNTSTGFATYNHLSTLLSTGLASGASSMVNYVRPIFNPLYATLLIKARASANTNIEFFFGFKETLGIPTLTMTENHLGVYFKDGVMYFTTGRTDGLTATYQNTQISGADPTRWLTYKFDKAAFSWYSLPVVTPYFDSFASPEWERNASKKWSTPAKNGACTPLDQAYYLVFYVKNATAANKDLEIQHVTLSEIYPD